MFSLKPSKKICYAFSVRKLSPRGKIETVPNRKFYEISILIYLEALTAKNFTNTQEPHLFNTYKPREKRNSNKKLHNSTMNHYRPL